MKHLTAIAAALFVLSTPVMAQTVYTGDRMDGAAVIDKLDVSDLPAGALTKLYFRVADTSIGQGFTYGLGRTGSGFMGGYDMVGVA